MYERVPKAMKENGLFCLWKRETRDGKVTKVPYKPNGSRAKPDKPDTFRKWDEVISHADKFDGVGILIQQRGDIPPITDAGDRLCCVDVDKCLDSEGRCDERAKYIMETMRCYCEKSPSGDGLHFFFTVGKDFQIDGTKYKSKNDKAKVEVYLPKEGGSDGNRYMTVTGQCLYGAGMLEAREQEVITVLDKYMRKESTEERKVSPPPSVDIPKDDDELLDRIRRSAQGSKFCSLYDRGDTSEYERDDNDADLALCNMLAWWTGGDADRMDSLFRRSKLMREKWDSKRGSSTYGRRTIEKAIEGCHGDFYTGSGCMDWSDVIEDDWEPPEVPGELMHDPDFLRLWKPEGEITEEGDVELCRMLSPHCGNDKNRIDNFFRQSGRMRDKWKDDAYRSLTLDKAISTEKKKAPHAFTLQGLATAEYKPTEWIIEGLLPAGKAGLFCAPQKTGKSWLCLDIVISRAIGRPVLGKSVKQGTTLYYALEDGEDRLIRRTRKLLEGEKVPETLGAIDTECPPFEGSGEVFRNYVANEVERSGADLVIFDVFQKIRGTSGKRNENSYERDYREMTALKKIFDDLGVSVLLVHHPRKGQSSDPFESASGSNAITAALDFSWVITKTRGKDDAVLHVTGRDVWEQDFSITRNPNTMRWENRGDLDSFNQAMLERSYDASPIVRTVRQLLEESTDGEWTGSGEQLRREATKQGRVITEERQALTKAIATFDDLFYKKDRISHQRAQYGKSGKSGSMHIFKRVDAPNLVEIDDDEPTPWDE